MKKLVLLLLAFSSTALAGAARPKQLKYKNLPQDLKQLYDTIAEVVVTESQQSEYILEFSGYHIKNAEDWERPGKAFRAEINAILENGTTIDKLEFHQRNLSSLRFDAETLAGKLFTRDNWEPYFCHTFKSLSQPNRPEDIETCKALTKELLRKLVGTNPEVSVLFVQGTNYGNDEQVYFYIGSQDREDSYLRVQFDIVHEI